MFRGPFFVVLFALAIFAAAAGAAPQDTAGPGAGGYPYAGASGFAVSGRILTVDTDRDLVTIAGDNGVNYTLDTLGTNITLLVGNRPGDTQDLTRDMRVSVTGTLLSGNLIAANQLRVLPINNVRPPAASAPAVPRYSSAGQRLPIELRGTVVTIDNDDGTFDVHVSNHQRKVYVSDTTTYPNIFAPDADIPLHPGDRVTVDGKLETDGTVTAAAVRLVRGVHTLHELVGRLSQQSSQYYTRDIQVRLDGGPLIKVHVPHDIAIERSGAEVSVHSLNTDDVLRIEGSFDGDDFTASRIDVLQPGGQ